MNQGTVAGARHINPLHIVAGRAADLDLAPVPGVDLHRTGDVDDLDLALRIGGAMLLNRPARLDQRPGNDQCRQCADRDPGTMAGVRLCFRHGQVLVIVGLVAPTTPSSRSSSSCPAIRPSCSWTRVAWSSPRALPSPSCPWA